MAEVETKTKHKYKVTCEYRYPERTKTLTLDDRRAYKERILDLFGLPEDGEYQIQRREEKNDYWDDLDDREELPDTRGVGELKIIVIGRQALFHFYSASA